MSFSDSELEEFFFKICEFDTTNPPGKEELLASFIQEKLKTHSLESCLQRVSPGRVNLLTSIERDPSRGYLLFAGHMDVVPATFGWDSDPFEPRVEGGRLYARGAADMKGGLAAMIAAFCELATDKTFKGNVLLLASCDEEVGCSGVKKFLSENLLPVSGALIGEPTSLRLATGEKGAVWLKLVFAGVAAHGSKPEEGKNAILELLEGYSRITEKLEKVKDLTFSLNTISGGTNENIVPDLASCTLDIRFRENVQTRYIVELIEATLKDFPGSSAEILLERESFNCSGPLTASVKSVLAQAGLEEKEQVMSYFTDGAFISKGAETVIIGPGNAEMAHKANEYIELDQLRFARDLYANVAREYFKGGAADE